MCLSPVLIRSNKYGVMKVACGSCSDCCKKYSYDWAMRCCFEATLHERNSIVTLTFSPEALAERQNLSVERRDVQLFIKRLRDKIKPVTIKFYACGEYGEKGGRPHYHIIIFGYDFPDKRFFQKNGNVVQYRSELLESCWKYGYALVGDFDFNSAYYCAKYLNKLVLPDKDSGLKPPFTQMSNRPGIGYAALDAIVSLDHSTVYWKGKPYHIQKRYLQRLDEFGVDPQVLEDLKVKRVEQARMLEAKAKRERDRKRKEAMRKLLGERIL